MRLRILTDSLRQKCVRKTLQYTEYSCGFPPFSDANSLVRFSCRFVRCCPNFYRLFQTKQAVMILHIRGYKFSKKCATIHHEKIRKDEIDETQTYSCHDTCRNDGILSCSLWQRFCGSIYSHANRCGNGHPYARAYRDRYRRAHCRTYGRSHRRTHPHRRAFCRARRHRSTDFRGH